MKSRISAYLTTLFIPCTLPWMSKRNMRGKSHFCALKSLSNNRLNFYLAFLLYIIIQQQHKIYVCVCVCVCVYVVHSAVLSNWLCPFCFYTCACVPMFHFPSIFSFYHHSLICLSQCCVHSLFITLDYLHVIVTVQWYLYLNHSM